MAMAKNVGIDIKTLFGCNLKNLREKAGYSQLELANISGLTHNFINDIEHCKKTASFSTIAKLSLALKIQPYMFFLPDTQKRQEPKSQYPDHIDTLFKAFEDFKSHYK
ncbi:MAG: helix-turn-helix domain-containing protein [Spirochaetaceae bacterium]|jgi:transcriptional regulator with XRE-family HTH domain|nr:helix-turn-helix domain-containing protein [Spirochaetaceae bacterium]